jgi:hypothetical protein
MLVERGGHDHPNRSRRPAPEQLMKAQVVQPGVVPPPTAPRPYHNRGSPPPYSLACARSAMPSQEFLRTGDAADNGVTEPVWKPSGQDVLRLGVGSNQIAGLRAS